MKKTISFVFFLFTYFVNIAQTITGNLAPVAKREIVLEGFAGLKTYRITSATLDERGASANVSDGLPDLYFLR